MHAGMGRPLSVGIFPLDQSRLTSTLSCSPSMIQELLTPSGTFLFIQSCGLSWFLFTLCSERALANHAER